MTSDFLLGAFNGAQIDPTKGGATSTTGATSANTLNFNSSSSNLAGATVKVKLYDEILREYGSEYASYVLQILANVYS